MKTLVLAPHMDDEVLGCGGVIPRLPDVTVAFMTERAWDVRVTEAGPVSYRGAEREVEMAAVAAALGYQPVRLKYAVHELDRAPLSELIGRVEDLLEGVDLMFVPAPSHDEDHAATRRVVTAVMRPHCFRGTVLEYQTWGAPHPYADWVIVPLASPEIDLKMQAMRLYATQTAPGGHEDELYVYSAESVLTYAKAAGRLVHFEYAEAFGPRRIVPGHSVSRLLA